MKLMEVPVASADPHPELFPTALTAGNSFSTANYFRTEALMAWNL